MFAKNAIFAFITFVGIFFILNIPKPNLSLTDYHNGGGINPLARHGINRTATRPVLQVNPWGREYVFYHKKSAPKVKRGFYLIILPQLSVEHRPPSTDLEIIDGYSLRMIQRPGCSERYSLKITPNLFLDPWYRQHIQLEKYDLPIELIPRFILQGTPLPHHLEENSTYSDMTRVIQVLMIHDITLPTHKLKLDLRIGE